MKVEPALFTESVSEPNVSPINQALLYLHKPEYHYFVFVFLLSAGKGIDCTHCSSVCNVYHFLPSGFHIATPILDIEIPNTLRCSSCSGGKW